MVDKPAEIDLKLYYGRHARWLLWREQFTAVVEALNQKNIAFLVLKGWAYSAELYEDLGERQLGDVDLLVKAEDLREACGLMEALAFEMAVPEHNFSGDQQLKNGWQPLAVTFQKKNGLCIDIHSHIITSTWSLTAYPITLETLWAHKQLFCDVAGNRCYRLSPEDHLLHLVSHIMRHGTGAVVEKSYLDLEHLLRKYGQSLDWERVMQQAAEWQMRVGLAFVFETLMAIHHYDVPEELSSLKPMGNLRRYVLWSCFPVTTTRHLQPVSWIVAIIGKLLLVDRAGDMLLLIRRGLFPDRLLREKLYGKTVSIWRHWLFVTRFGLGDL
jgi:hypothetical protein